MSYKSLGVITSDGRVLGGGKSREQLCHKGLSANVWAQLMVKRLASVPPCHIALLGSQKTPDANLPAASRRMCWLLPTFHKEESVTIITFSQASKRPICPHGINYRSPATETSRRWEKTPSPRDAKATTCAVWLAGQEDGVGTCDVIILSILIAGRILTL